MNDLELTRKSLPNEPGVYLFLDKLGKIIYVGKAINLRKRVNQYFLKTHYTDPYYEEKIMELVKNISSIEFFVTENEKEAYILENIQIKRHLPRFNVIMRDSKTYPWVAIFYSEDFPRIRVLRNPERYSQDNLFLGPFTDKKEIVRILRDLRKIFPYCSCKKPVKYNKNKRPCLYYQLNLCPGPCFQNISKTEYLENINEIELFLKGETEELKHQITSKMKNAAKEQNYEVAAFWRDKLQAIDHSTTSQSVLLSNGENKDILGFFQDDKQKYAAVFILHIREGRIQNKSSFLMNIQEKIIKKQDILPSLMEQYYQDMSNNLPDIIVIPFLYKGLGTFSEILKDFKDNIVLRIPLPEEQGLLRIANKNAKVMVNQEIRMENIKRKQKEDSLIPLKEAMKILDLSKEPRIIEGFDISNIEGQDATGSMVCFLEGKPYKKNYRHYKIRSKATPDDVAMMQELLRRRYTYLLENNLELPDLILVDGGKPQLNAGVEVLKDLNIEGIPIIGLAKKFEEIYKFGAKDPIILDKNSPLLKLFQRVRNEAHRFAIRLHKKQRGKRSKGSILDDIKGIGPVNRNKLLNHFGSVKNIRKASLEEISKVVRADIALEIKKTLKE